LCILWKFAGGLLGIDFLPINENLEATVIIGDKGQLTDALFVFGEQLFRQTDGFRLVPSRCAVFDANLHIDLLKATRVSCEFK
jgi:hypothetical protein